MTKKKASQLGGLVYSTHAESLPVTEPEEQVLLQPNQQNLRLTLDKKLKAGKKLTVVYNFVGPEDALIALSTQLKAACGVGGSAKQGEVLLQGDCLEKVKAELTRLGYRFKVAGV